METGLPRKVTIQVRMSPSSPIHLPFSIEAIQGTDKGQVLSVDPCLTGLQIVSEDDTGPSSSSASGKFLSKKSAAGISAASSQLLPAVLVRVSEEDDGDGVDPLSPGEWAQGGMLKHLACLGADNRLMKVRGLGAY